ncbi:GNAT family N-acetyltransferase [Azospirillum halopraeferens]|uniref:GNAT family N-acetyltransferase n=1 Tax=Azospirillum halopraeferens TaxID=34010 RepID=UPI0009FCF60E|nr:GNAT family N-acetyltransferase [Azospirillum halopraeferens]
MNSAIHLAPVLDDLPLGIDVLRTEAACEGYQFLERLVTEWKSNRVRFAREEEALLAAYVGSELVGIGGITIDPAVTGALRMRRFYVRAPFRRLGIGRKLALSLLERSEPLRCPVMVNAGAANASAFWEALGFMPDPSKGHTHIFHPRHSW